MLAFSLTPPNLIPRCHRRAPRCSLNPPSNSQPNLPNQPNATPPTSFSSSSSSYSTSSSSPPPPPPPPTSSSRPDPPDDLPPDLRIAFLNGSLTAEALSRYRSSLTNPILSFLMSIPSFRIRALADSQFFFKLLVQEAVGNGTALASEIAVRGKDVVHELEYVASDLIVGTVVEAAFVWLLAPRLNVSIPGGRGWLSAVFNRVDRLPTHMFQAGQFPLIQRLSALFVAGTQYMAIGFAAGIVGTAITYGLIESRKRLDKSYIPERPLPDVIPNSLAWGVFMAVSSNIRFQIVEGLEMLMRGSWARPGVVALRLANNYWGGVQFVQFFRYMGLHAVADDSESHPKLAH